MKVFKTLVKREFWEHRGSVFYTPAIMIVLFAVLTLVTTLNGTVNESHISFSEFGPKAMEHIEMLSEEKRSEYILMGLSVPAVLFGIVLLIISVFYALGSLYDERKDRSILFWKSLPVSDTETVLSKFVAITVMVPLFYFVAISIFQVFLMVYGTVIAWFAGNSGVILWTSSNLFSVFFNTLVSVVIASLWLAPLWGWLMLASAWAKKVAFLWGILPIGMIAVAEYWVFSSSNFGEWVVDRLVQGFLVQNSFLYRLDDGASLGYAVNTSLEALQSGAFWLGLVIAAVLLAGAVYTRRYRDES